MVWSVAAPTSGATVCGVTPKLQGAVGDNSDTTKELINHVMVRRKPAQSVARAMTTASACQLWRCGDPHLHTDVIVPNRQARADGQLLSIDGTSLYHEATSHVGRRSRSTRAGAPGLSHRCADCAPSCSQRGRPGTPSPPTVQCRVRRRSPWPPHHRTAALESARRFLGAQMVRSNPCSPRSPNARPCAPFGAIPSSSERATTCASA